MSEEKKTMTFQLPKLSVPVGKEYERKSYPEGAGVYIVSQENGTYYLAEVCNENEPVGVIWLPVGLLKHLWENKFAEKQQHIVEVLMDKFYDRLEEKVDKISFDIIERLEEFMHSSTKEESSFTESDKECLYETSAGVEAIHKKLDSLSKTSGVSEATLLEIISKLVK